MPERPIKPSAGTFCIAVCACATAATASTFALRAVTVNGNPIPPSSYVAVHPEDIIECEIFLSDWGGESFCNESSENVTDPCMSNADCPHGQCEEFRVGTYQADITLAPDDSASTDEAGDLLSFTAVLTGTGGDSGELLASESWRRQRLCSAVRGCPPGSHCQFFPRPLAGQMSRHGICRPNGLTDNPISLSYIDITRPDFIFRGVPDLIVAVDLYGVRFGGLVIYPADAVRDDSTPVYLGTLFVRANQVGGDKVSACGPRDVSLATNLDPCDRTFLVSPLETDPLFVRCDHQVEPLTVDILCSEPDALETPRVRKTTPLRR